MLHLPPTTPEASHKRLQLHANASGSVCVCICVCKGGAPPKWRFDQLVLLLLLLPIRFAVGICQ